MAEYIEREALINAYDLAHVGPPGGARKLMLEAPAVDVAPVVHGRWLKDARDYYTTCICSECGNECMIPFNFCHDCGAKMDLQDDETEGN